MKRLNLRSMVVLSAFFILVGCMGPAASTSAMALEKEHLFTLKDLNGQPVSLAETMGKNKVVLINFWATWCPPCREEIPGLIKLHEEYSEKGLAILGVDVGESQKKVSSFAKKMSINYPVLLDENMAVARVYNVYGIPTSYLVDSQGKLIGVYHEFSEELVLAVEKALM